MKIFISGGTGFIGTKLSMHLADAGHIVTVGTRNPKSKTSDRIDYVNYEEINELPNQDIVIHLATEYGKKIEVSAPIIDANILLPVRLMDFSMKKNVKAFINTDSYYSKIIGNYHLERYIKSKSMFREWCKFYNAASIKIIHLYLEHVYGPGDSKNKFCAMIIDRCLNNSQGVKLTSCDQRRDFVYVDDVVSAYNLLINSISTLKSDEEIQIGTGETHTLRNFVELARRISKSEASFLFGKIEKSQNELDTSCADTNKLSSLGWRPAYSLQEGLNSTISITRASYD